MARHKARDFKLFEEIKRGDHQAFKKIFTQLYPGLCRYMYKFTGNEAQAKDIVQEAFIKLWNKRSQIVISTSLKSYLYRACYNKYIDHYRKEKYTRKELEDFRYAQIVQVEEQGKSLQKERVTQLRRAIEDLPPKCKEIFILSKYKGLRYKDIAQELGLSVKTVEAQMGIAYTKLREVLKY